MTEEGQVEETVEATQATEVAQETQVTEQTLTGHQQFLQMLPEDMRSDPLFRNFDGEDSTEALGKMAKSYVNAQKLIGADPNAVLKIPSNDEDPAWNDVYNKIGRPEKPDDYNMDALKDVPGVEEDKLKEIAEVAHKNGVSNKALGAILDTYKTQIEGMSGKSEADLDRTYSEYEQQLKGHFGDAYDQRTQKIASELKSKADPEFLQLAADYPWVFDHPAVIKTFDAFIRSTSEDSGPRDGKGAGDHAMTPAEAEAEIRSMEGDPSIVKILMDPSDPRQKDLVAKRAKLFAMANPSG